MDRLFTFILDYEGGTYVSQMRGTQLDKVFSEWIDNIGLIGIEVEKDNFVVSDIDPDFSPIDSLTNAWCITFFLNDKLALVNIVETVS